MNVASLELCKELYELSGWGFKLTSSDNTDYLYENSKLIHRASQIKDLQNIIPAYDLGYLLRKCGQGAGVQRLLSSDEVWIAVSGRFHPNHPPYTGSDTPEDAAAKLCIELFKHGILTKDGAV